VHFIIICNKARTNNFAGVQDHYMVHLIVLVPINTLQDFRYKFNSDLGL